MSVHEAQEEIFAEIKKLRNDDKGIIHEDLRAISKKIKKPWI